jgi:hypothetical protein
MRLPEQRSGGRDKKTQADRLKVYPDFIGINPHYEPFSLLTLIAFKTVQIYFRTTSNQKPTTFLFVPCSLRDIPSFSPSQSLLSPSSAERKDERCKLLPVKANQPVLRISFAL